MSNIKIYRTFWAESNLILFYFIQFVVYCLYELVAFERFESSQIQFFFLSNLSLTACMNLLLFDEGPIRVCFSKLSFEFYLLIKIDAFSYLIVSSAFDCCLHCYGLQLFLGVFLPMF